MLFSMLAVVGCTSDVPPPQLVAVEPGAISAGVESTVTIRGRNFWPKIQGNVARPEEASVDVEFAVTLTSSDLSMPLTDVQRVTSGELAAIVPAQIVAGTYAIELVDPRGRTAFLADALHVIEGPFVFGPACTSDEGCVGDPCSLVGRCVAGFCVYDRDADSDRYIDASCGGRDCDDGDDTVYPGATETLCDGIDQACDGPANDDRDDDNDTSTLCGGDCDDGDAARFPGNSESCDGIDNDCNDMIDDGLDQDGDGVTPCGPDGTPGTADDDCDDSPAGCGAACNPSATEICDAFDNDCSGSTDEGFDQDSDGVTTCGPDGTPGNADDDCDDLDPARTPGRTEECDAVDNDCSSVVDDDGACPCIADYLVGNGDRPYLFCKRARDFAGAEIYCASLPTYELVSIADQVENDFVEQTSLSISADTWYIGYSDRAEEGTFVWVDGTSTGYDNFNAGEPNNSGDEDCVMVIASGGWNDVVCGSGGRFVCEGHPENRNNLGPCVDVDGDDRGPGCALGPDCDEGDPAILALMGRFPDDDEDGLTVASPQLRCVGGLRPSTLPVVASADIDCDDGNPSITTPCECATVRDGATSYAFCETRRAWTDARDQCRGLGLELVKVDDAAESAFLHDAASGYGISFWIGLNDLQTESELRWVSDGSLVSYEDYHPGEPNDAGGNEDCTEMTGGGWNDFDCAATFAYICE
jgi:hypothetical protein